MILIILNDLWLDVKKNFLYFICYFIVYFCVSILGIQIALVQFLRDVQTSGKSYSLQMVDILNSDSMHLNIAAVGSIAVIFLLWLMLKRIPLRLSKPLYVCAAGKKEKMHYLRLHLLIKLSFSLLFTIVIQYFMTGTFLISKNWQQNLVQIGLWFFLLLVLNLRTDPGNRKEMLAAAPDMVSEKSEEVIAGIYWFALLLLENIVFYTMIAIQITWNVWMFLVWIALFILNVFIAKRCISPVLAYMLSYEKMYYPLPDKKE